MGDYKLIKKGNVLHFQLMGQMDIETGIKYANSIKPYLSELGSDWATMIDLNDWGLHIPEVSELMENFHGWLHRNGHRVEVCITGNSDLKIRVREKLLEVSNTDLKVIYVETKEEGWAWLSEHGYV